MREFRPAVVPLCAWLAGCSADTAPPTPTQNAASQAGQPEAAAAAPQGQDPRPGVTEPAAPVAEPGVGGTPQSPATTVGAAPAATILQSGNGDPAPAQVTSPGNANVVIEEESELLVVPVEPPPTADEEDCDNILDVTYRDFTEEHIDFEMDFAGDVVRLNLVESTISPDGKPLFLDSVGCPPDHEDPRVCGDWDPTGVTINSAVSFDDWYHTVDGVNIEIQKELELTETAPGSGVYVYESTAFFPLEPDEGFGVSPRNHHMNENFLFTTEIHLMFTYEAGQLFTFRGDDDLWIFINDKLALDLGSMHNVEEGTIDFDALATELGISPGGIYRMDVFHAERHTTASNFRIETNIGCFIPAVPRVR